jgi:uncharacterized LabA/DUF88 family protein
MAVASRSGVFPLSVPDSDTESHRPAFRRCVLIRKGLKINPTQLPVKLESSPSGLRASTIQFQINKQEGSNMERIVLFNDYANTNAAFQGCNLQPDFRELADYLSEGRFLVEAHAYVPIDPRNPRARERDVDRLWNSGWLVHTKLGSIAGDSYKCDLDVEITLDLMRTAEIVKPDIVVLLSGDKDFVPVILELRKRGIRVEVAAFPGVNAAREVRLKASGFIDLEVYVNERREQQNEPLETDDGASLEVVDAEAASQFNDTFPN